MQLAIDSGSVSNAGQAIFNLTNGTVGSATVDGTFTNASASIQALPNGWYRCSVTATTGTETTVRIRIRLVSGASTVSYTGDNTSGIFIWQAQLETGSVATSPIVTTGSTASRVADVVSLTGASSLIGQTEGAMFLEAYLQNYTLGAISTCYFGIGPGGATDIFTSGIFIGGVGTAINQPRMRVSNATVNTVDIAMTANQPTGVYKFGVAYATNDVAFYANGAQIGTDSSATIGAFPEVYIGSPPNNTTARNPVAWIRSVALFPTRLENTTLATLTTL
jgi:hypothetical protein